MWNLDGRERRRLSITTTTTTTMMMIRTIKNTTSPTIWPTDEELSETQETNCVYDSDISDCIFLDKQAAAFTRITKSQSYIVIGEQYYKKLSLIDSVNVRWPIKQRRHRSLCNITRVVPFPYWTVDMRAL